MADQPLQLVGRDLELDRLVLIVVGAHLRAEAADRPIAYSLRERMLGWMQKTCQVADDELPPLDVLVCSDVWWLNNDELRKRPTISIGGPGVNALSAYFGDKIPSAFVVDDVLMVQMDVELTDLWVCIWGINHQETVHAEAIFAERYLDQFMQVVLRRAGVD